MIESLVVDANPLLTALLGGRAREILFKPVLALALRLRLPVWTEDRDFENLPGVSVYKTADLLPLAGR